MSFLTPQHGEANDAYRAAVKVGQQTAALVTGCTLGPDDDQFIGTTYRAVADGCHWNDSGRWASTYAWNSAHPEWAWMSYFTTL